MWIDAKSPVNARRHDAGVSCLSMNPRPDGTSGPKRRRKAERKREEELEAAMTRRLQEELEREARRDRTRL